MSGASQKRAEWFGLLEPPPAPEPMPRRADDPRLGEIIETWDGTLEALRPGRPVLVGFPQDEGVRRNGGRPRAAEAPAEIRPWLSHLTTWDGLSDSDPSLLPPLHPRHVRPPRTLEAPQPALRAIGAAPLAH